MKYLKQMIGILFLSLVSSIALASNETPNESQFDSELNKVRYDLAYSLSGADEGGYYFDEPGINSDNTFNNSGKKSPGKAFLLSLAVPGLGQYYYGSRIKPIAFIGVEAAAWILNVNWHSKGEDLTAEFEQYNRDHWNQSDYERYLQFVYGASDDEDISATEISHHLPDTRTQQYYEMTGKYNQFAWGWDDAVLNGMTQTDFDSGTVTPFPPAITSDATTPYSARRITYETMRDNANKKFNNANKMVMVAIANHLISALEAYVTTKKINSQSGNGEEFSNFKIRPTLRSYNQNSDTPYVRFSYKF